MNFGNAILNVATKQFVWEFDSYFLTINDEIVELEQIIQLAIELMKEANTAE